MRRALDETERRREKQLAFNAEHGIIPRGIQKAVTDIMEGARGGRPGGARRSEKVAEEANQYARMSPAQLAKRIDDLERRMYRHAENLEFEQAAALRDDAHRLREQAFEVSL